MNLRKSLFLAMLLLSINELKAQKSITHQSLYWIRYYNQLSLNKKWTWHNEFEDRRFFENNRQNQFILHSRMHYNFYKNTDVAFGLAYSLQSPQDPNSLSSLVIPEIRPYQEINYNNPINNRLSIHHRFRLDERFIHKNNGKVLLDGYDFNFRFRYKLQANIKLSKIESKNQSTLKIYDELMINAGKNIVYNQFDQNRVYLGLEQSFNKHASVELGYLHWYQQRTAGNQFFDRDILRLTIYHKMKL